MANIESLAEQILEYQADVDWYGLCDDYGNIETDQEVKNQLLEEIVITLQNNPNDILKMLKENMEELECDNNYQNNEIYIRTKKLIEQIENYK